MNAVRTGSSLQWRVTVSVVVIMAFTSLATGGAGPPAKLTARLQRAAEVLHELVGAPDQGIPKDLLSRAQAIAVFPDVLKGAFFFGGRLGDGVMSVREPDGSWSAPAFFAIGGGSWGLQIGGEVMDLVLVVMTRRGVESLLRSKVTLGLDLGIAAGPVGRRAEAATDIQLKADILSYSRSKGLFAGVSLEGSSIHPDDENDEQLYGHSYTAREILLERRATPPDAAKPFLNTLQESASGRQ